MTRSVSKVPLLGSLPVLGWLFRSESTKKQKTNLLLFLTPHIIRDQSDVRRIFERKMAEREEFVRRFYGDDAEQRRHVDYDHKPGPLSRVRRGVAEELAKFENGGQGGEGERVVGEAGSAVGNRWPGGGEATPGVPPPGWSRPRSTRSWRRCAPCAGAMECASWAIT